VMSRIIPSRRLPLTPKRLDLQYIRSKSFDHLEKISSTHERIPFMTVKLASKAEYADWLDAAEEMLHYYNILEVVHSKEKQPKNDLTSGTNLSASSQKAWDMKNKWAKAIGIHNIGREVHREMQKSRIASEMWKALENLFDRKTTSTLPEMVGNLMTLRYSPEISVMDLLSSFANQWNILV
ncbi:hypothetical protein Q9L58_010291, partial [Maublancomyces gigas]